MMGNSIHCLLISSKICPKSLYYWVMVLNHQLLILLCLQLYKRS
uniref:Uncharacterized protein n=1 Tax=Arundo donax TaxID=35708 RepID=A0A0A9E988_ARUDO